MIRSDQLENILNHTGSPAAALEDYLSGRSQELWEELPAPVLDALKKDSSSASLRRFSTLIDKYGISSLTSLDPDYPQRLLCMEDPPHILFYIGEIGCLSNPQVAMVGSRHATVKGLRATEKIAEELSNAGLGIVSGLAYGIDAASHKGCLKGKMPTVAVLGCGLDQNYPAENQPLHDEILRHGGLILSEFAPGEKPLGWHFPVRNRIISGLSDAVILMEARIRSGSMTTVHHALDQGKDIFVYPGEPGAPSSEGNHQLLREGATYFTEARDILEDLGWLDKISADMHNIDSSADNTELTPDQQRIMTVLGDNELGYDELFAAAGLSAPELSSELTMLQLIGKIEALPGKQFRRKY